MVLRPPVLRACSGCSLIDLIDTRARSHMLAQPGMDDDISEHFDAEEWRRAHYGPSDADKARAAADYIKQVGGVGCAVCCAVLCCAVLCWPLQWRGQCPSLAVPLIGSRVRRPCLARLNNEDGQGIGKTRTVIGNKILREGAWHRQRQLQEPTPAKLYVPHPAAVLRVFEPRTTTRVALTRAAVCYCMRRPCVRQSPVGSRTHCRWLPCSASQQVWWRLTSTQSECGLMTSTAGHDYTATTVHRLPPWRLPSTNLTRAPTHQVHDSVGQAPTPGCHVEGCHWSTTTAFVFANICAPEDLELVEWKQQKCTWRFLRRQDGEEEDARIQTETVRHGLRHRETTILYEYTFVTFDMCCAFLTVTHTKPGSSSIRHVPVPSPLPASPAYSAWSHPVPTSTDCCSWCGCHCQPWFQNYSARLQCWRSEHK